MFKKIINWFKYLLHVNPVKTPPQKAPLEIVEGNMTNEVIFHEESFKHPLTVNALVHGGTLKQRIFMKNALNILRHVVISDEFQNRVLDLNFTYTDDNALKIYKKFLSGRDLYDNLEDAEMDIDVHLYYKRNKTIGYTYPNTRKTWMNMKHFDVEEYEMMAKVVMNLVHEYMHNLGYGHPHRWTKTREFSVPYAYGYAARDVAMEFLGSGNDVKKFEGS